MNDYISRKAALVSVGCGCNPYDEIGNYIKNHITVAEDIIATIEIDGRITNELFMVEIEDELDFVWKSDWWEGENNVKLIDFFPVSEAVRDKELPQADVVNKTDLLGWLLAYHKKSFELKGRYMPHEVIGWLINDLTKNFMGERGEQNG